jgi:hypothetical protein
MLRWVAIGVCWVIAIAALLAYEWLAPRASVGAGYVAKELCSCIFVAERDLASCRLDVPESMDRVEAELLEDGPGVRAKVPLLAERVARYAPGEGCTLH